MYHATTGDGKSLEEEMVRTGVVRTTGRGDNRDRLAAAESDASNSQRGCVWQKRRASAEGEGVSFAALSLAALTNPPDAGQVQVVAAATANTNLPNGFAQDVVAPTTTATFTSAPPRSASGAFTTDVTVTLTATDAGNVPGAASGVARITYSINGATPPNSVNGATANIPITADGTTTITFFATDNNGNVETPKQLAVTIDRTAPPAAGGAAAGGPVAAQFEFDQTDILVDENVGTLTISVRNRGNQAGTVRFSIREITAKLGRDFLILDPPGDTLTYGPGETVKTIRIQIIAGVVSLAEPPLDDAGTESNLLYALPLGPVDVEQQGPTTVSFAVTLFSPSAGASLGGQSTVTFTIRRAARFRPPSDDDTDRPRKETEEERQQRERTNEGGKDDVHTEGHVEAVERAADGRSVLATIALIRDETQVVQVACWGEPSAITCPDIQVGDYLEADGEQHGVGDGDSYFVASDGFEVRRGGKKVK
jgi:hypothetical protein